MKALVGAFNQEKALLVGAFSVIVQLHRLIDLRHYLGVALGGAGQRHVAPLAGHQQRPRPLLDPRPGGQDVHNHILGSTGDGYCTNTDTNYSLSLIYLKKILEIQFCECTKYKTHILHRSRL